MRGLRREGGERSPFGAEVQKGGLSRAGPDKRGHSKGDLRPEQIVRPTEASPSNL